MAASMEGRPRRREHRSGGGRFRAEIEMDGCSPSVPRGPGHGFAPAVREPLVRLQRPKFDFERWDWDYFTWPHDRLDANLEMRDGDPEATLEADRRANESFLNWSMLQLETIDQDMLEQHAAAWPCEQHDANLEMSDSDLEATFEEERNSSEGFLTWSLQLEGYVMEQHEQDLDAVILPRNQHNADQVMSTTYNRRWTPEADQKNASESLLCRSTLQLKRRAPEHEPHTQGQPKEPELRTPPLLDCKPVGRGWKRHRAGCADANGILLNHGRVTQGSDWAF